MRKIIILYSIFLIFVSCDSHDFTNPYDTNVVIQAPSNLRILNDKSTITLKWDDNSTGEEGFKISRRINQGNWDDDYYTLSTENATGFTDNSTQTVNTYSYKVRAYAGQNTSNYSNTVENEGNLPPNQPSNLSPSNNATSISLDANLSWTCTDPEGDPLTYDVYFGTDSTPDNGELVSESQSITTYSVNSLDYGTDYYWKIVSKDDHGNSTVSNIWKFTTLGNLPPNQPSNLSPSNNATSISLDANLSWTCTDPEGDPLTYDVYFGTNFNPPLVNSGQSCTTYDPGTLNEETPYYWKIKAHDDHSNSTTGDVWEFTTQIGGTGTVTDIDGNVYQTIIIGDQEWMMENLKVTRYRNGDLIPNVTDNYEWVNTTDGAYCVYNNDPPNADTYGNLYNLYAVEEDDNRGLAPEGWHVPTDDDWKELEMFLGMTQAQADDTGWRGTNEGSKLAGNASLWYNGDLENNSEFGTSGFSALPGGYRSHNGNFYYIGYDATFWSSSESNSYYAWYRKLYYEYSEVYRYIYSKKDGFSVRCVRD